ncbi:MAG: L-threonylcarbamoyladenylate synthase [Pseudomonadota bacterium]
MILPASAPDSINACADTLRAGELVGLPTETVYGLAADADNERAVAKIFVSKGRPADHPLIVHVSSHDGGLSGVAHFTAQVPPFAQQLMSAFWPGPLTLILPRRGGVGKAAAGGQSSIGLRCPAHPAAQAVLRALRDAPGGQAPVWGVAAPSANRFGRVSPTTAAHVDSELGPDLLVLDGGPCDLGIESTIIDCTRGAPVLLRPGSISRVQVEQACGQRVLSNEELAAQARPGLEAPRASGTLESHYAPNATVRLMNAKALQTAVNLLGDVMHPGGSDTKPTIAVYARTPLKKVPLSIALRRMPDDATATAHQLFAVLRAFDATGVKLIWVETPPETLEWDGVRDRLQRASAPS